MSYPTNADGTLSFSQKGAREYALTLMGTADENQGLALLAAVAKVDVKKGRANAFKAKLNGCEQRIEGLNARIAEEEYIRDGGEPELKALQADAAIEVKAFMEHVRENHA